MDGSEGGQTVEYAITRTLNSATQATLSYPSSGDVPVTVQYNYTGIDLTSVVIGPLAIGIEFSPIVSST